MFEIEWKPKAVKQLRKIPASANQRIRKAVNQLENPDIAGNVKPLQNHRFGYRMRVGDYRVLFDIRQTVRIVMIEEVRKRDERTY
jgi:mRNA-degrading endonuclease RelE of RelBE toxin-antitoxin system